MTEATACFGVKGKILSSGKKKEKLAGPVPLCGQEAMGLMYDCLVLGTWTLPFICSGLVQQKYNAHYICNLKFSSSTFKKF